MLHGWHSESFLKRQAIRNRRSVAVRSRKAARRRETALELRAEGRTVREIAAELGVHRVTVYRMLHLPTQDRPAF